MNILALPFPAAHASDIDVKPQVDRFGVRPLSVTNIGGGVYCRLTSSYRLA